jgi:hypothetical protein
MTTTVKTLNTASDLRNAIEKPGFLVMEKFASLESIDILMSALDNLLSKECAGMRQLHQRVQAISDFLRSEESTNWIEQLIPGGFPVRSILFDKTRETNWQVTWHQDLSICVKERHQIAGFGSWSTKDGTLHVQPPASVLEGMLTVRLHLDDCTEDNGPLRVIPGSHRKGRLSADKIALLRDEGPVVSCTVARGGAVVMKPLILHSSSAAANPGHRRVLHIEFASEPLPYPLEWIR